MSTTIANVEDVLNRFMPVEVGNGPSVRFSTNALVGKVTIYHLVAATESETKSVMAALTLCGRSMDSAASKWQSWVCTWSCLVFPELVSVLKAQLTTNEYVFVELPREFVQACYQAVVDQGNEATSGDKYLAFPPGLPSGGAFPVNVELAQTANLESLYQYYAMLVFILGKSLNPDTAVAISTRRPEALMRKANSRRGEYILQGDGRIPSENYARVQSGWVKSTGPRYRIVAHLANMYASSERPEALDPIVVNMDMLRNSGQSYIYYIHELVTAHPWCVIDIHPLRATWKYYVRILNVLQTQPAHIVPFYKMMVQDSNKDVRRKEIEPLIGVAIFFASQTRPKMNQYRIAAESRDVIEMFVRKATEKGYEMKQISNQATIETTTV